MDRPPLRAIRSAARAPALHAGGRRFESCIAHHFLTAAPAAALASRAGESGPVQSQAAPRQAPAAAAKPHPASRRAAVITVMAVDGCGNRMRRELSAAAEPLDASSLGACAAASLAHHVPLGPSSGQPIARRRRRELARRITSPKVGCAEFDGFFLHADVRIAARDRGRLERLCRYLVRPPISDARLAALIVAIAQLHLGRAREARLTPRRPALPRPHRIGERTRPSRSVTCDRSGR